MRFVLLAEGHTEKALKTFLKKWLDKRLKRPVGIQVVRFHGCSHQLKEMAKKAEMHLNAPGGSAVLAVISLLDLHRVAVPGTEDMASAERYLHLKRSLEGRVGNSKFRQFFAVHEVEAWLLSDPSIFPRPVSEALSRLSREPEAVNDNEPPSKLLDRLYREKLNRGYAKIMDGTALFEELDPEIAHDKCRALGVMLDEMLQIARDAGL